MAMGPREWDARYAETPSLWGTGANVFVTEVLGPHEPGRALDLACGEGRNSLWLAERGWRVTGVDFSRAALAKARAEAGARALDVEWVEADVTEYRPEPGAFDAVVIAYLHLPGPALVQVLRHAAEALAPSGTLVVVGHDATNPAEGVGGPQDLVILYTARSLAAAVPTLRIERAERVRREVAGCKQPALDALLVATRPDDAS
jgi:SAM-dependent methyltransferase